MRRTNSDYFGYCAAHHIPDVTDLVIVELDADDTPYVFPILPLSVQQIYPFSHTGETFSFLTYVPSGTKIKSRTLSF